MSQSTDPCCAPGCCGGSAPALTTLAVAQEAGPTTASVAADGEALRATVRDRYARAAVQAERGAAEGCCGSDGANATVSRDPITGDLYRNDETTGLPVEALHASLGCGNPTALATLLPGETVLDLGAGGGIDVLLSARRVGPTGKAFGLDMTDEMLALARANQARAGATNVEFLKGIIEDIPLPDASVDVVISNCVINLSADKPQVLREAFRVLRPGGRLAVSDVVLRGQLPPEVAASVALFTGCVSGALHEDEYRRLLLAAGFTEVDVVPTRVYGEDDVRALMGGVGLDADALAPAVAGKVMGAFVRAVRPVAAR